MWGSIYCVYTAWCHVTPKNDFHMMKSWNVLKSITRVTASRSHHSRTTSSHRLKKSSESPYRKSSPLVDQCLRKSLKGLRWVDLLSQSSSQFIPNVFDGIQIWWTGRPIHDVDTGVSQEIARQDRCMGCSVVLLKCQPWTVLLHERQQFRCQHLITVLCCSEVALDDNQSGTTMGTKWTPNHYAAATKSVDLLNTTLRIAFLRSTPHPYPAISKPKCETWLVTKDNVIPASLVLSNVPSGPFQTLTTVKWRENGSCVWSPSSQTSRPQSIPDGGLWHPTPEQLSACGCGRLEPITEMT